MQFLENREKVALNCLIDLINSYQPKGARGKVLDAKKIVYDASVSYCR